MSNKGETFGPRNPLRQPDAIAGFGRSVRKRRIELGLTLRACAEDRNFSYGWLSQLERGKRNPTLATLLDIADALNTPLASLIEDLPFTPGS